jgi:hypothetical protein
MGCPFMCGFLLKFESGITGCSEILVNIYQTILVHRITEDGNTRNQHQGYGKIAKLVMK